MLKKRNAQGLSITTIVIAAIALIVLVVIIAILTGRLGIFSKGLDEAVTCETTCNAIGKDQGALHIKSSCDRLNGKILGSLNEDNEGCCCFNEGIPGELE